MLAAGLVITGSSQAKAPLRPTCRSGYVRRTVRVPERKHGRIVRHHNRIVYVYVHRCVRRRTPITPSVPTVFPPAGTTTPFPPFGQPSPPPPPTSPVPSNTAPPTVSGNPTGGSTLTASSGTWTNAPTSYTYQWQQCDARAASCQDVSGATGFTYLLGTRDIGSTLRVSVTAGNAFGQGSATSAAVGPVGLPSDPIAVAVGDIACPPGSAPSAGSCQQQATEQLAASQNPNAVLVLGDNQYDSGTFSEYTGAFALTWGFSFNPIVHPVPGNHEYVTSGAAGYFQYFGDNGVTSGVPANPTGGYYSFNLGTWHIIALNSNCSDQNGCADALAGGTTSAQTSWLQSDLAANREPCVLAMWHHPLFSYGFTLGAPAVAPLWTQLYNAHADVILNGHDHLYERFAQLNPSGGADPTGIREFVVGTGGESLFSLYGSNPPATLQDYDVAFGVLALTLHADGYSWKFVNTSGTTVDSGTTACHGGGTGSPSALAARVAKAPSMAVLSGPPLVFDARLLQSSLAAVLDRGLPVAVHLSRAADVTVTVSVRHGQRLQRIAAFYETESQIPKPYTRLLLHLSARQLSLGRSVTFVVRLAATDSAGHRRIVLRTATLR
jgi:hypothetical protein